MHTDINHYPPIAFTHSGTFYQICSLRLTVFKIYYAPPVGKRCFCLFVRPSVRPSIAYIANNSRTQRPSVSKFGRKAPHLRCDLHTSFIFKVKRSKVKVIRSINAHTSCYIFSKWQGLRTSSLVYGWRTMTRISHRCHDVQGQKSMSCHTRPINADTHRAPYLPNGKAYELQNWYTDGGRRPASATCAMTPMVKSQGRKVTWSIWAVLAQCCTCVIRDRRGHNVSMCRHQLVFSVTACVRQCTRITTGIASHAKVEQLLEWCGYRRVKKLWRCDYSFW